MAPGQPGGPNRSRRTRNGRKSARPFQPAAEKEVRSMLILEKIAETEKIAVGDDELGQRLERMARELNQRPEALRSYYQREDRMEDLRAQLREEKTLDFLLSQAKITETRAPPPSRKRKRKWRRAHEPDSRRRGADLAGRKSLRHLLPSSQGPDHLHRHPDRRLCGQPDYRPAALSGGRRPGQGHSPVSEFPRRTRDRRPGHLRHDAIHQTQDLHPLHGAGGQHGGRPAGGRGARGNGLPSPTPGS